MLANGIKLGFKTDSNTTTYTDLTGLKSVPDMGIDPEKVENTCLSDENKQYEYGIGDYGDLEFKFKYENKSATSPYRVMRKHADNKDTLYFCETYPDGTKFEFSAQVNVKLSGGEVNGAIEWTMQLALQSDMNVTDPTA